MKPLLQKDIKTFVERFDHFKDSELKELQVLSPQHITLTLTAQDTQREFDWICVQLDFHQITDAQIVDNDKLPFLDFADGVSLFYDKESFFFGLGNYTNSHAISDAQLFIQASSIKIQELPFS